MKTVLLLLFILICLTLSAQEYKYVSFPDSNAIWSEIYWKPISQPSPRWVYNQYALFNEDTVINEVKYHKLFQTKATKKITHENSVCIGGIREDNSKNIWFYCFLYKVNCNSYFFSSVCGKIIYSDGCIKYIRIYSTFKSIY